MKRRVVVTGMGIVSCIGDQLDVFQDHILKERSGIGRISWIKEGEFRNDQGGEVNAERHGDGSAGKCLSLVMQATEAAIRHSRFDWANHPELRVGVCLGTNFGDIESQEACCRNGSDDPTADLEPSPFDFHRGTLEVARRFRLRGPRMTISTACASGGNAIGFGFDMIRYGRADAMIVGAYDVMSSSNYSGLNALHAITVDTIRPFDQGRSGTLLGEGAGVLVLEAEPIARQRNAAALVELLGYGMNNNAFHLTAPSSVGVAEVMQKALADAQVAPEAIDYINAHGTGTKYNDVEETKAIKKVFGSHSKRVAITAVKPYFGHTMGAAGSIEAIATIQSILCGVVPRILNFRAPDAQCDLNYAVEATRKREIAVALCNSYGFGGNNSAIILRRYPDGVRHDA